MASMDRSEIILRLKQIIIDDCDKDVEIDQIDANEQLIAGPLKLDSLDALQICMTVKNIYGVRIEGGPDSRAALQSIKTLADTIIAMRPVELNS